MYTLMGPAVIQQIEREKCQSQVFVNDRLVLVKCGTYYHLIPMLLSGKDSLLRACKTPVKKKKKNLLFSFFYCLVEQIEPNWDILMGKREPTSLRPL